MRAIVLVDNKAEDGLACEWGLSIWVQHNGLTILLDAGASDAFADNAQKLGLDLAAVDVAVLSHAHYDHAGGFDAFFARNDKAPLYLAEEARENCYGHHTPDPDDYEYIGMRRGLLKDFEDRIVRAGDRLEIAPGVTLLAHDTPGLEGIAAEAGLFVQVDGEMRFDDFAHERSLVLETDNGLVVLNSCSHARADNIIHEVLAAFPGNRIRAYVGGLHLFNLPEDEVRQFAQRVKSCGIENVYTGHCTGDDAYRILEEELGESVHAFYSGLEIRA